jgi:hypothetical protein
VIALVVAVVVVAGVVAGLVLLGGGDDAEGGDAAPKRRAAPVPVELVSVFTPGPNPFTPPLAGESPPASTIAPPKPPFGGTGDNTLCDREGLVTFLTDPANAAQARAWAGALGIDVTDIPGFVRALVPTTTEADIRVTNHRFEGGQAVPFQAVLEGGTALLVDTHGRPVARCRCGNPLRAPRDVARPVYRGTRWDGFDPDSVEVVRASGRAIFPSGGGSASTTTVPTVTSAPSAGAAPTTRRAPVTTSPAALAPSGHDAPPPPPPPPPPTDPPPPPPTEPPHPPPPTDPPDDNPCPPEGCVNIYP